MYKRTNVGDTIQRLSDGAFIPIHAANPDYQQYLADVAKGTKVDAYVAPPPTVEQTRDAAFKASPERADLITRLKTATPAQIDTWFDANVTTLAQARTFLKTLTKVLALVVKE